MSKIVTAAQVGTAKGKLHLARRHWPPHFRNQGLVWLQGFHGNNFMPPMFLREAITLARWLQQSE
jgi:hypothetical protein